MRHVLSILLLAGLVWLGWRFYTYTNQKLAQNNAPAAGASGTAPGQLPGMSADLEPSLAGARRDGVEGLRRWLWQHGAEVRDPRLADIEMDYVVLVGPKNPAEARRVLDEVGVRLKPSSPAYKRHQQLARSYASPGDGVAH
jgi:hypothetical protein